MQQATAAAEAILAADNDLRLAFDRAMQPAPERRIPFVIDIRNQMLRRGRITDKQRTAVLNAVEEKYGRRVQSTGDAAGSLPVGEGVTIEGIVTSTEERDTDYGVRLRIKVRGAGWTVLGYAPKVFFNAHDAATACDPQAPGIEGRRVRFEADVKAGNKPNFGFFNKPRAARIEDPEDTPQVQAAPAQPPAVQATPVQSISPSLSPHSVRDAIGKPHT